MTFKHGDKIFVAIAVLICVEISTFSRMYLKASGAGPAINNQDGNRRTSNDPTITSGDDSSNVNTLNVTNSGPGNIYIRSRNHDPNNEEATEILPSSEAAPVTRSNNDTSSEEVKARIVFLGDDNYDSPTEESALPPIGRSVEPLGDLDCCSRDPFEFITPEEKPFYEECEPMANWQTMHFPTCNMLHELPLIDSDDTANTNATLNTTDIIEPKVTLINTKGSWRSVWKVITQLPFQQQDGEQIDDGPQEIVLKTLRYDREFDEESFRLQYVDSMAMERLTSSPYIANEYGFCGQSVLTEFAPKSGRDLIKNKKLKTWQRLQIAHDLAAALSDMHSIDYANATNATFTHNDINIANTIQGDNGRIKFNDFNIGVVMRWNKTKPCGSPVKFQAPLWRAPEEIRLDAGENVTETIMDYVRPERSDTYALGNLLFQVLTTHQPWTWLEPGGRLEVDEVIKLKLAGDLPYIPSKFRDVNTTGVQAMFYATLACYAHDPLDRPTSYQLAGALHTALDWTQQGLEKSKYEVRQLFDFRQSRKNDTSTSPLADSVGSRRLAATSAAVTYHDKKATALEITTMRNNTVNATSTLERHFGVSDKIEQLLQQKHKQVQDAEIAKRTIERRVVRRPKIGIHHFSPPLKHLKQDIIQ